MKPLFIALAGFGLDFLAHTLFGSISFLSLAFLYAYALYLLFFTAPANRPALFLAGITAGEELSGGAHFGLASSLAAIMLILHAVFALRLRFTSLYLRYIVALLLNLTAFAFILFPAHGWQGRMGTAGLLFPFLCLGSYLLSSLRQPEAYELL